MTQQTFLALHEPFVPRPAREAPLVYVARLRIFGDEKRELRDIALAPGLNVIWAPDAEPDERVGTKIGHGAGKTLFCRLLRYALGEPSPASPADTSALLARFPHGFVRADVKIAGVAYLVQRPFDVSRPSTAWRDGAPVDFDTYLELLAGALGDVASTLDPWRAALAWASRDQERRFGGPLRWRDRLVCPDSRIARVANLERASAIRSLLGLRDAADLDAESEIKTLELTERLGVERLAEHEREIAWLASRLARETPDGAWLEPIGLAAQIRELSVRVDAIVDDPGEAVRSAEARFDAANTAVVTATIQLERLEALRAGEDCGQCHGEVPRPPTKKRLTQARSALRGAERERGRALSARELARKTHFRIHAERFAAERDRLARAKELLRHIEARTSGSAELADVRTRLAFARDRRDALARRHHARLGRVSDVFDFVVRRLAGQDHSGKLTLTPTAMDATIVLRDGRPGRSPAMRVLATLALDLTALILGTEGHAHVPGFWIHDSPREADLARSHYDALYRLIDWLADATPTPGFQYIVTTTTRPPATAALRAIRLGAASEDLLLLGTVL